LLELRQESCGPQPECRLANWKLTDPGFRLAYCLLQDPETWIQFLTVGTGEIQRSPELCPSLE
jgi:hypothetical protein